MFKLKNKDLNGVYQLLYDMEISTFKLTRKRGKFMEMLMNHFMEYYEKGKDHLIEVYSQKDENGQPKKQTDENGNVSVILQEGAIEAFTNELEILDNEYFQLDITESNVELLKDIYEIVSNDEFIGVLKGAKSVSHNLLCNALEEVL